MFEVEKFRHNACRRNIMFVWCCPLVQTRRQKSPNKSKMIHISALKTMPLQNGRTIVVLCPNLGVQGSELHVCLSYRQCVLRREARSGAFHASGVEARHHSGRPGTDGVPMRSYISNSTGLLPRPKVPGCCQPCPHDPREEVDIPSICVCLRCRCRFDVKCQYNT